MSRATAFAQNVVRVPFRNNVRVGLRASLHSQQRGMLHRVSVIMHVLSVVHAACCHTGHAVRLLGLLTQPTLRPTLIEHHTS